MDIEPVADHGQKIRSPEGRVVGFFSTKPECEAATKAIEAAGYPPSKIIEFYGEEGARLFERSQGEFFMGDGETDLIQRGIVELRAGHCILGVEAQDHDEAVRLADIGRRQRGYGFSYFGTFVSEQLTK